MTDLGGRSAERRRAPLSGRGEVSRARLLQAARQVFGRLGYLDTSIADITTAARVSQPGFYTYFESKDEIFRELARTVIGEMVDALSVDAPPPRADPTPRGRVRASIEQYVEVFRANARFAGLIEQVGTLSPDMYAEHLRLREMFTERASSAIARMQRDGVADRGLDAVMTAEVLGAMVYSTCYTWLTLGQAFDETRLVGELVEAWSRTLRLDGEAGARVG
ncbi:TetR/AcrR family transcriptional regulator [Amycolatopsis acidicola]|uniref:TetR/AcrR family transcriptional regulator n=1 Tax=Amycolatopsis acidicola TaxID=2596893 RepID=A0A5N0UNL7_9PSEU|nr:TetR/AcrR family transcriptional regulator [Amycolatopsis acidicola]KAA9151856.1 TetR/AcrR family transcriptional regulator [Amycolatopsis acidicola]